MRWLVTGATGFVGGAVAQHLAAAGEQLVLVVRSPDELPPSLRAHARMVSLGDPNGLAEFAKVCDVAVHAAAVHGTGASERALRWINVAGTENLLNACVLAGVRRFIYVSCADVTLVDQDRMHWNEAREEGAPLTAHGRTKLLAEELVRSRDGDGILTVALRPALIWGPGDRALLRSIAREAKEKGVFRLVGNGGNFIATTYIEHLVTAIVAAADAPEIAGRAFYVTDNVMLEAREFYGDLCEAFGLPAPTAGAPYAARYLRARLADGFWGSENARAEVIRRGRSASFDIQDAVRLLAYEPKVSLAEGMNRWKRWVVAEGGLVEVVARAKALATDASVDAMVAAAGGD